MDLRLQFRSRACAGNALFEFGPAEFGLRNCQCAAFAELISLEFGSAKFGLEENGCALNLGTFCAASVGACAGRLSLGRGYCVWVTCALAGFGLWRAEFGQYIT